MLGNTFMTSGYHQLQFSTVSPRGYFGAYFSFTFSLCTHNTSLGPTWLSFKLDSFGELRFLLKLTYTPLGKMQAVMKRKWQLLIWLKLLFLGLSDFSSWSWFTWDTNTSKQLSTSLTPQLISWQRPKEFSSCRLSTWSSKLYSWLYLCTLC